MFLPKEDSVELSSSGVPPLPFPARFSAYSQSRSLPELMSVPLVLRGFYCERPFYLVVGWYFFFLFVAIGLTTDHISPPCSFFFYPLDLFSPPRNRILPCAPAFLISEVPTLSPNKRRSLGPVPFLPSCIWPAKTFKSYL